jgi:hypothetical protein
MAWDETKPYWFNFGGERFPRLERWKELSAVLGASRSGPITKVDTAVDAAYQASSQQSFVEKQIAAGNLFRACDVMLRGISGINLQAKQRQEAVSELRTRADRAQKYFAGAAPVVQKIMQMHPNNIFEMLAAGRSVQVVVDALFKNFVAYAHANWSYKALATPSGEAILAGRANEVFCASIADAFGLLLDAVLPGTQKATRVILKVPFVTKPEYHCFDPKVTGNIFGKDGQPIGTCLFSEHHFAQWAGLYYDACMGSIYTAQEQVVAEKVPGVNGVEAVIMVKTNPTRNDFIYVESGRDVPGFQMSYVRVKIADVTSPTTLQNALPAFLTGKVNDRDFHAGDIVTWCSKVH